MNKKKTGRPVTVMTQEVKEKIVKAVSLGLWPNRAAEMHGVNPATMRSERKRDQSFATSIKEAEARAEATVHGQILRHMESQWTAAAWMLERRWPDRWAKRDPRPQVQVQVAQQQAIAVGPPVPPLEELKKSVEQLCRYLGVPFPQLPAELPAK